jgi:hypothetical protein
MRRSKARQELAKDLFFILVGVAIAIVLARSGFIDRMIVILGGQNIASFTAGIFFTSAFTLAPATIAFAHISQHAPVWPTALWGGMGAMLGDLVLFLFIRDKFAADLRGALKPSVMHHIASSFHFGFIKWLSPLIGALIIASPLPDEFGLALMGMSRTKLYILLPVAFVMNVIGIYMVATFAQFV